MELELSEFEKADGLRIADSLVAEFLFGKRHHLRVAALTEIEEGVIFFVSEDLYMRTDGSLVYRVGSPSPDCVPWSQSPDPRRARLFLTVAGARKERLQDISDEEMGKSVEWELRDQTFVYRNYAEKDAWFQDWYEEGPHYSENPLRDSYISLYNMRAESAGIPLWDANPEVFALSLDVTTRTKHGYFTRHADGSETARLIGSEPNIQNIKRPEYGSPAVVPPGLDCSVLYEVDVREAD